MENKKQLIQQAVYKLAGERGLINITRAEVCAEAGISDGSFSDIMDLSFTDYIDSLEDIPMGDIVDRKRVNPKLRRKQVLELALDLAKTKGYRNITRGDIAIRANISPALVTYYFTSIEALRVAILKLAIKQSVLEIIAQGLVNEDPLVIQAPKDLKYRAVAYLAGL